MPLMVYGQQIEPHSHIHNTHTHTQSVDTRKKNGSEAPGIDLDSSKRDALKWSPAVKSSVH